MVNANAVPFRWNGRCRILDRAQRRFQSAVRLLKSRPAGEISRIMLALKTVLVQVDEVPTLLFDEIDAGIGGRVADVVGKKLKELSAFSQVICITHLPQIARFAEKHFRVEKKVVGERTLITAKALTAERAGG